MALGLEILGQDVVIVPAFAGMTILLIISLRSLWPLWPRLSRRYPVIPSIIVSLRGEWKSVKSVSNSVGYG